MLQVLVVHFHVEAVGAVELAALGIVAFDWSIDDFYKSYVMVSERMNIWW